MTEPEAVKLDLQPWERDFLRGHFESVAAGLRGDLERNRGGLRDPEASARALSANEALAAGVAAGAITPSDDARRLAGEAARVNDQEVEWQRVAREHLAFGAARPARRRAVTGGPEDPASTAARRAARRRRPGTLEEAAAVGAHPVQEFAAAEDHERGPLALVALAVVAAAEGPVPGRAPDLAAALAVAPERAPLEAERVPALAFVGDVRRDPLRVGDRQAARRGGGRGRRGERRADRDQEG